MPMAELYVCAGGSQHGLTPLSNGIRSSKVEQQGRHNL